MRPKYAPLSMVSASHAMLSLHHPYFSHWMPFLSVSMLRSRVGFTVMTLCHACLLIGAFLSWICAINFLSIYLPSLECLASVSCSFRDLVRVLRKVSSFYRSPIAASLRVEVRFKLQNIFKAAIMSALL